MTMDKTATDGMGRPPHNDPKPPLPAAEDGSEFTEGARRSSSPPLD